VGRISGSSGAVVKGASVTVTDLGTNESRLSATNSDGDYRFVNLDPRRYRVDVKMAGSSFSLDNQSMSGSIPSLASMPFYLWEACMKP
jgi:hypothetical protein